MDFSPKVILGRCVCVFLSEREQTRKYVCVCEREREREREREGVREARKMEETDEETQTSECYSSS